MKSSVAWIDDVHLIHLVLPEELSGKNDSSPSLVRKMTGEVFPLTIEKFLNEQTVQLYIEQELPMGEELYMNWNNFRIPVFPRNIVRTAWFEEHYTPTDCELGAICHEDATTFTLWAPTATSVYLVLDGTRFLMSRQEKGIWSITIHGDWHGKTYEYEVDVCGKKNSVIDPYAKSSLANTKTGVVINLKKTEQIKGPRPKIDNLQDAIIYELHIRDMTIDKESGIKHRGKYLGLTEENTTTKNGFSTGLSYIKELGVTHVELLPINDFARVNESDPSDSYNWGYDPLLYQAPEGSYATNPNDPVARINECKKMIEAFHNAGIGVIIDVVFNHVFIEQSIEESNFEQIVPGYYFRYNDDGTLANSTRCGNDFASERKMARKFILDTVDFWLREYHVDGFRFDLMGVIDIDTMKQVEQRIQMEPIPVMVLGEGWNLPTPIPNEKKAITENSAELKNIRFFNDLFRDTLKGQLFNHYEQGYVNGNGNYLERLPLILSGSCLEKFGYPRVTYPTQSINYVECHDNHTLWDRLTITNEQSNEEVRKKMHQMATGLTLLSQGIPFIHAGQEWFRTKHSVENSYNAGDKINALRWEEREKERENVEFVKSLIQLRKTYQHFRMDSKAEISHHFHILITPHPVFGYTLLGDHVDFVIYVNPTNDEYNLHLPSPGRWKIMITNEKIERIEEEYIIGEFTTIFPYEFLVLMKQICG